VAVSATEFHGRRRSTGRLRLRSRPNHARTDDGRAQAACRLAAFTQLEPTSSSIDTWQTVVVSASSSWRVGATRGARGNSSARPSTALKNRDYNAFERAKSRDGSSRSTRASAGRDDAVDYGVPRRLFEDSSRTRDGRVEVHQFESKHASARKAVRRRKACHRRRRGVRVVL